MPFSRVGEADIYWKLEGCSDAPALVLLNSIGTDMDLWDGVVPALRDRFRLLRIDTRGHGASRASRGDYSLALLAEDILSVAADAGIDCMSVAGVSLGGMIAMQLALVEPARVTKLALICTSATMDSGAWDDRVQKVREQGMASIASLAMGRFLSESFRAHQPAITATIERQLGGMDPDGYAGCAAAIRDMQIAERLGDIPCPTLVITGTRDSSTPFEGHGEVLLRSIAGASHQALATSHLAPIESPTAIENSLCGFLLD